MNAEQQLVQPMFNDSITRVANPERGTFDFLTGNYAKAKNAQNQMEFNAMESYKNRQFQQFMSNTATQRSVADMMKAGINPIMASKYQASTPTGNSAQGTSPHYTSNGKVLESLAKVAITAMALLG